MTLSIRDERKLQQNLLFGANLAGAIGNTGLQSVLPAMGRTLHLPDVLFATALSLSALLFAIANPFWAKRIDSTGAKRCILIGMVAFVLTMLVSGVLLMLGSLGMVGAIATFIGFVICRGIYGWYCAAMAPAAQVYMASITTVTERTNAMVFLASAIGLGTVLGPALSPFFILPVVGLSGPLYVYGTVGLIALVIIIKKLPEMQYTIKAHHVTTTEITDAAASKLKWTDPRIVGWMLTGLVSAQVIALIGQPLAFLVIDMSGLTPAQAQSQVGLVLMSGAVASLLGQWGIIPRFYFSPRSLVLWGSALSALGCVGVALSNNPYLLALAFGVASIGFSLSRPGSTAGASLAVTAQEQATVAGLIGAINGYVYVVGPPVGMLLYGLWHPLPFLVCGLAMLGTTIYGIKTLRH